MDTETNAPEKQDPPSAVSNRPATSFANKRKVLRDSSQPSQPDPASQQKKNRPAVERFGFNKAWKLARLSNSAYPVLFLLAILGLGIFVIWPSGGMAEFKWWMPLLVIALIIWAIYEISKYRKAMAFLVVLSEETIRVGEVQVKWEDIERVENKAAFGDNPTIILHLKTGKIINIPAAIESIQYIRGFVEGHTSKPA